LEPVGSRVEVVERYCEVRSDFFRYFAFGPKPVFQAALEKTGLAWASMDISDDDNSLWEIFSIGVVPTVIIFRESKAVFRRDGILRGPVGEGEWRDYG
jgi:hypothetical protein